MTCILCPPLEAVFCFLLLFKVISFHCRSNIQDTIIFSWWLFCTIHLFITRNCCALLTSIFFTVALVNLSLSLYFTIFVSMFGTMKAYSAAKLIEHLLFLLIVALFRAWSTATCLSWAIAIWKISFHRFYAQYEGAQSRGMNWLKSISLFNSSDLQVFQRHRTEQRHQILHTYTGIVLYCQNAITKIPGYAELFVNRIARLDIQWKRLCQEGSSLQHLQKFSCQAAVSTAYIRAAN